MVFTNSGKQFVAWSLGSDLSLFVNAVAVGIGSGTALVTDSILIDEKLRNAITGNPDFSEARKVKFQADFSSVSMSGIKLMEFGTFSSATADTGSTWQREGFGSIVFDGTNELQILSNFEVL